MNAPHPRIPIVDLRPSVPIDPTRPVVTDARLRDTRDRPLRDLRISVTDRCNFRCTYCMPKDVFDRDHRYLPHADLLTFEEIERLARAFVALGVEKVRLTGGEPLLRRNVEELVAMLSAIELPPGDGIEAGRKLDLTLTTNGSLLRRKAAALRAAGLGRVTVSLDALDDARFRAMNDVDFPVAAVLDGIDAAKEAGFGPVKINMVVKRGVNDDQVVEMARRFRGTGHILRFIEFMDVGASNRWTRDEVVPTTELVRRIDAVLPIEPVAANYRGEVAERWRYRDGSGEIGMISSVTQPFCGDCSRARISPEGSLYTCLFASRGVDLRSRLRSSVGTDGLSHAIASVWTGRTDRHSEIRGAVPIRENGRIEMSYIGG